MKKADIYRHNFLESLLGFRPLIKHSLNFKGFLGISLPYFLPAFAGYIPPTSGAANLIAGLPIHKGIKK